MKKSSNFFLNVREARLELACPSGRHPLKMVCLPVPPLAQIFQNNIKYPTVISIIIKLRIIIKRSDAI